MRVGLGYDVHKLVEGRKLIIGGVNVPHEKGYGIGNIDCTIIAQSPKMAPHIQNMRENIAKALNTSIENINVKATTEEGLGFTGAKEGIAAQSICLLVKVDK